MKTSDLQSSLCAQWLEDYKRLIAKVVRMYARTQEDGQDLYQEIALQLLRSMERFQGEAKVSTWIYRVALNTAMAWSRQHRRQTRDVVGTAPGEAGMRDCGEDNSERLDWLYAEIQKLPEMQRSLVLLYLDGLSYREMSAILGITESNVGVMLHRTRSYLGALAKGRDHDS